MSERTWNDNYEWLLDTSPTRTLGEGDDVSIQATGYDGASKAIAEDPVAQCRQAIRNVESALTAAGLLPEHVRHIELIVFDDEHFMPCCEVLDEHFGDVEIEGPARLAPPGDTRVKVGLDVWARKAAENE